MPLAGTLVSRTLSSKTFDATGVGVGEGAGVGEGVGVGFGVEALAEVPPHPQDAAMAKVNKTIQSLPIRIDRLLSVTITTLPYRSEPHI
jgi:hypothetical protein